MGPMFERRDDVLVASFRAFEVELIRDLRGQLHAALTSGDAQDPVLQRLFPSAVLGDQDADTELRRLLRIELMESRLVGLDDLMQILDRATPHRGGFRVELEEDEPLLVLGVLNDLRLAIGARIDIESLDREAALEDEVLGYPLAVMDHLAGMQEQLLEAVDPASVAHYEDHRPGDYEDHRPGDYAAQDDDQDPDGPA